MKIFLNILNIIGYICLIWFMPLIFIWYFILYTPIKIMSILVFIISIYFSIKIFKKGQNGLKIFFILVVTITLSTIIYIVFGLIKQAQIPKLLNEISSIEIVGYTFPINNSTIPNEIYENSFNFVNVNTIFLVKWQEDALVNFKNGKSTKTKIIYFNASNPIIRINNYNYTYEDSRYKINSIDDLILNKS